MRLLVALLCIAALFSCSEKNKFILNGTIKGVKNDKIVLGTYQDNKIIGIDTVDVVDGRFSFKRNTLETSNYSLKLIKADVNMGAILENGKISLIADIKDADRGYIQKLSLTGATNQNLADRFFNMQFELLKDEKYANASEIAEKLKSVKSKEEYAELTKKLNILAPNLEEDVKKAQLNLIKANIDKYFVTQFFWMLQRITTAEEIKKIYAQLPEESKKAERVVNVMNDIKIKESIQPGKVAPDFTLKTPDGKDISLSDLRGQYVLVDFWASWCKPCRASFPHMKELYKKYHAKGFEILGVTNDTNHKAWKKAIKDDGIPWLNVADEFPVKGKTAKVITAYGMDYLPSTVLIDKDGVIIAKLLHGDELDHKLEELFGF